MAVRTKAFMIRWFTVRWRFCTVWRRGECAVSCIRVGLAAGELMWRLWCGGGSVVGLAAGEVVVVWYYGVVEVLYGVAERRVRRELRSCGAGC